VTTILIIDDEPGIRDALSSILEDEGYKALAEPDAAAGIEALRAAESIPLVILDVLLPKLGGLEALERIRADFPLVETVVISGHANIDMAVRAIRLGAFDFLEKPLSLDRVLTVCRNALTVQRLREENASLRKKSAGHGPTDLMIGASPALEQVRRLIRQAAASEARILITGENGTGKELAARAVHAASPRSGKPFVEVNCAAIPDTLIESELFGHEKGAFTDAVAGRAGRFERAAGGTLFLDEIGDMSLTAQAKVLRAIQERKIQRVGGEKIFEVDTRILAATNQNLEEACEAGRFRRDLFFRLNVIPITIPPLRERREDILLLLFHFLQEHSGGAKEAKEVKEAKEQQVQFDQSALEILQTYRWPGNVRELENLAKRIKVIHSGGPITGKILMKLLGQAPESGGAGHPELTGFREIIDLPYTEAKERFEKRYLEHQMEKYGGAVPKAAEAAGIYPSNLRAKLRKYGIKTPR
jgi:two-component system nitrogen regulation response regulator NtrX